MLCTVCDHRSDDVSRHGRCIVADWVRPFDDPNPPPARDRQELTRRNYGFSMRPLSICDQI
jgi:hypothetical protein